MGTFSCPYSSWFVVVVVIGGGGGGGGSVVVGIIGFLFIKTKQNQIGSKCSIYTCHNRFWMARADGKVNASQKKVYIYLSLFIPFLSS